jgi:hypothetical protein
MNDNEFEIQYSCPPDRRKPGDRETEKKRKPRDLSDKAREHLMKGDLDKLSDEERKKVKPKDVADIPVSLKYILLIVLFFLFSAAV